MEAEEKKRIDNPEPDITEISIDRIRSKNSEFVTLNRIFSKQKRKLHDFLEEMNSEIERSI